MHAASEKATASDVWTQVLTLCESAHTETAACHKLADTFVARLKKGSDDPASRPVSVGCTGKYLVVVQGRDGELPKLARMDALQALNTARAAQAVGRQCHIFDSSGRPVSI